MNPPFLLLCMVASVAALIVAAVALRNSRVLREDIRKLTGADDAVTFEDD